MAPLDDSYDLALAASSLRASSADVHSLLKALAQQLTDALGERMSVQKAGGLFKKSDQIAALRISLSGDQFEAVVDGSRLKCTVGHISGGIKIRTETLDMEEWLLKLLEGLNLEAAHSESAQRALENIVIGGQ